MSRDDETTVETQVRLVLEQQVVELFRLLWEGAVRVPCELTVVVYDLGDPNRFHNVAFKTSLPMPELVRTVEAMLERWATGKAGPVEPGGRLPHPDDLHAAGELARLALPGVGYSLIFGRGTTSVYISNAARDTVAALIRDDLLPHWRA